MERGVFQRENLEYLSGEYESFLTSAPGGGTVLQVSVEVIDPAKVDREGIRDRFIRGFIGGNPHLRKEYDEGSLTLALRFAAIGSLGIFRLPGRPRRLVDRRG